MRRRRCTSRRRSASWRARSCSLDRYQLAFLKGDAAQMAQLASAAMGKPGTEDLLLAAQADTEAWYGKLKNAHELTRRAMDSAQHNDAKETCRILSGSGGAARGGIGKPGAGTRRCQCCIEAGPEPRCARRWRRWPWRGQAIRQGRRSWRPNSTRHSRWTRWSRDIGCPRSGRPSPWSAKTRTGPSNY